MKSISGTQKPSRQRPEVREFILRNVKKHPANIAALTAERHNLSRAAVAGYLRRLVNEGLIEASGTTRARRYTPRQLVSIEFEIRLQAGTAEDPVWTFRILPQIENLPENVVNICQYGFTEILNNAIDHSASRTAIVRFTQTYSHATIRIIDHGVGIFKKIQQDFHLHDPRQALLELSKGRLTSDVKRHSGQGIFFTSRMFDEFSICSGELYYSRVRQSDDDWLIEGRDLAELVTGTFVEMTIATNAAWTTGEIVDKYQRDPVGFTRTHVPIALGKYPGEQLVSRSQAKRVLTRVERFSEIILDFQGVQDIGPAFADEIFRVFRNAHPDITITPIRTNTRVQRMIRIAEETPSEIGGLGAPP